MTGSTSVSGFSPSDAPSGPSLMEAWSSGQTELGSYQLVRPVGSGGMGAVFEAIERQTGRRVALKTLHRTDPGGLIALKGEFRRMADLVHPNLALLHELVQDGELIYFAMEFVEGLDFYRYVTGSSLPSAPTLLAPEDIEPGSKPKPGAPHRFRERRLRNSLTQLASGVLALHQSGLLHLDLKPANVLVENGGRVVILDFGLVRPQSGGFDSLAFCGTPAYMAPEQAEGRAGPPADAYAMGVMLFEALTGDLPFDVRGHAGIFGKLRSEAPSPSSRRADVPRDLEELCIELLARDPGRRPSIETVVKRLMPSSSVRLQPRAAMPAAPAPATRSELVGRDDELELLFDALERCRNGEATQVYIDGLSGVGKTALLQRFAERAQREQGTLVLEARCYERESIPYKAVDALIDSLAPHLATRLHAAVGDLSDVLRVFPALGANVSGHLPPAPLAGDPHEARRRAFRGLRALIADLARDRPLVLAVDDLQWGDLDSARLLVEVLAPPGAPLVLFVGTYRSEERAQSAFLQELLKRGPGPDVTFITLSPLTFADAEALALELIARDDADAHKLAREIASESGGNPLLIDSLISHRASADPGATQTAASLDSVVLAALASLPPEARRLLEVATVAGRPLPQGLALKAASVSEERHPVLARLRTAHLIRTRGTTDADPLDVYHDRIREVLYAHIPRLTLRSLHRHLAITLEKQGDVHADLLARQFSAAGMVEKAGHYATVAAERASGALAFNQAAELYTLAVECRPEDLELGVRHAEALVQAGHGAEAAHAFLACARSAPPERALVLERNAARQLLFAGHVEEGINLLRPILAHYRLWLPGSRFGLGVALAWRLLRASLFGTEFSLKPAESVAPETLSRIDTAISVADGLSSIDLVRAAAVMLDALHLALRAGERSRIAWTLAQYGMFTATKGSPRAIARGEELLARAENLGRGLGDANLEGAFKLAWAKAAIAIGDFRAALARADACAEHLRSQCASAAGPISIAQNVSLMALECLGDFDQLRRRARANLELAATLGDRYVQVTSLAFSAQGHLASGDANGAQIALREGRQAWSTRGFMLQNWLMLSAEASIALYEGDPLRAWTLLEENWSAIEGSRLLDVQLLRVLALRLRGNAALACLGASSGPTRKLTAQVWRDAEQLERQPQGHARAAAAVLRAGIAWFEGDSERAALALTRAIAGYEHAGMVVAASSARLRRSLLSGSGASDAASAAATLRERGIAEPDRYSRLHAP